MPTHKELTEEFEKCCIDFINKHKADIQKYCPLQLKIWEGRLTKWDYPSDLLIQEFITKVALMGDEWDGKL